jgi:hypothetical protein
VKREAIAEALTFYRGNISEHPPSSASAETRSTKRCGSITWAEVAAMAAELHFTASMLQPDGARPRLGARP